MPESEKSPKTSPVRLDALVASTQGISRRQAQKLIAEGCVELDGRHARKRDKGLMVAPDASISLTQHIGEVIAEPGLPLKILAEGRDWVAVDKPAGMPVHPLGEGERGTLLNGVAARFPAIQGVGACGGEGGLRSGVVHRLDVATSGVVVFALTDLAWNRLRQGFSEHQVKKEYVAVVRGQLDDTGEAVLYLAVQQHRPAKVAVVAEGTHQSRRCTLRWTTIERTDRGQLLSIDLETGFLHQIRVTLAHLGAAVVNDPIYGNDPDSMANGRLLLHAVSLGFSDVQATSPLPDEFVDWLHAPSSDPSGLNR